MVFSEALRSARGRLAMRAATIAWRDRLNEIMNDFDRLRNVTIGAAICPVFCNGLLTAPDPLAERDTVLARDSATSIR